MVMKRRLFIASSLSLGFLGVSGLTAWNLIPRNNEDLSIATLLKELRSIDTSALSIESSWTVGQSLAHMAQSIEYSITGYPVHKSEMFKSTVGRAAFTAFSSKGQMKHNLKEDIPGAPSVANINAEDGMTRLLTAFETFQSHQGELAEHFAYGPLGHEEYALAHVLHVKDHFTQLV
ncbi:hypothetical protein MACH26_05970 [Planctobacterium marinum]|uniref:DUF1569 domain-containing protein n=2 Tax=Planctobacterium marinum TaxID=1631968 RepID=A0AA48HEV3_9ALTE|nr:hypothetical protein MACH26_05970 [Planctobacterium marinum]